MPVLDPVKHALLVAAAVFAVPLLQEVVRRVHLHHLF